MLETVVIVAILAVLFGRLRSSVQAQSSAQPSGSAGGVNTPGQSLPPWASWNDALALGWDASAPTPNPGITSNPGGGGFILTNPTAGSSGSGTGTTGTGPAGGGSTSGGGGAGGCPEIEMYISRGKKAGKARKGDLCLVLDVDGMLRDYPILREPTFIMRECYKIESEHGSVIVSEGTPCTVKDGRSVFPPDLDGEELPVCGFGEGYLKPLEWEKVKVTPAGKRTVVTIDLGGKVFASGIEPNRMIFTHNMSKLYVP